MHWRVVTSCFDGLSEEDGPAMRAATEAQLPVFTAESEAGVEVLARQIIDVAVHVLAHRLGLGTRVKRWIKR